MIRLLSDTTAPSRLAPNAWASSCCGKLAHAVKRRLIPVNPTTAVDAPSVPRTEMRTFDADQTAKLLAAAEAVGPRWHAFIRVTLTTGMRLAELTGPRWQDVDLDDASLTIPQTIQRLPKMPIVVKAPKTATGRRTIPLGRDVVEALRRHRAAQAEHRLKLGPAWQESGLVFPSEVARRSTTSPPARTSGSCATRRRSGASASTNFATRPRR